MFARKNSAQASQTAPTDNPDSHPDLSEEANNYPTLQLTRSDLGLDGKMRSRAQGREGDRKQNEHLAVQSPSSGISIETGAILDRLART